MVRAEPAKKRVLELDNMIEGAVANSVTASFFLHGFLLKLLGYGLIVRYEGGKPYGEKNIWYGGNKR